MPTPEFILRLREKIGHDPLWLSGVTAVVLDDLRRVLLVRRADSGVWTLVTGCLDPGEQPAAGAVREVWEETGLRVAVERALRIEALPPGTYPNGDRVQFLDTAFQCRVTGGEARVNDDESTAVGWFDPTDTPTLSDRDRSCLTAALDDTSGFWFQAGEVDVLGTRCRDAAAVLRPTYPILTTRLALRPFTLGDLEDVHAYQRQPAVARWMSWEPRDRAQSLASVRTMAGEDAWRREGDCLTVAVVATGTGRVVGQVELVWRSRDHREGEIGYVFDPGHQGHGFATEAATAMLRWAFEEAGLHRVVGRCAAANEASARLMERLGMRREAYFVEHDLFKGEWVDRVCYAMLDREWRARTDSPTG